MIRGLLPGSNYPKALYISQTATNALFLWLGIKGIINCIRQAHDRIFILAYIGYIVVGLGSIAFHATLKCASPSSLRGHLYILDYS